MQTIRKKADVAIVGSGPGGASVARHLAQAGKKVLLMEKGRDHQWIGNHFRRLISQPLTFSFPIRLWGRFFLISRHHHSPLLWPGSKNLPEIPLYLYV